jgi:hypothetical protein
MMDRFRPAPPLTHPRAKGAPAGHRPPAHSPAMASSPARRLRKTGAVDQDGNLVTVPRLPTVSGANKLPRWDQWSPAGKVRRLVPRAR